MQLQVWCSRKREDADRKLSRRFLQYLDELPPARTALVVLSSDQDIRSELRAARSRGFDVHVVHAAATERWRQVNVCMR
jgi:hypothetical protein